MKLTVLGSSSKGNCYVLDNGTEALIIEAGVRFVEVKKALGFNIRKVVGCLVTHRHGDHAKYIQAMLDNGIYTLAVEDVWTAKGVWDNTRSLAVQPGKGYKLGNFKVLTFPACHDVPCVGFVIDHPETGRILFLTDSYMCEYRFQNLSQIMIECNYSFPSLERAIAAGATAASQRERLLTSHQELNTCKEYLRGTDLSQVENVVLLHLSEHNSDEARFVSEVQGVTGKIVNAAYPGMTIEMNRI